MNLTDRRVFLNSLAAAGMTAVGAVADPRNQTENLGANGQASAAPQSEGNASREVVFNVRGYGATGEKSEDARPAIQQAIDACAAAGGGVVYLPPGEYMSGGLKLRNRVRIYLENGATLFASTDPQAYKLLDTHTWGKTQNDDPSTAALFQGDELDDISIEGQGTVDGQATFIWRPDTTEHAFINKEIMKKLGKSLMRTYPTGFPKRQIYPHLVWLRRCTNVRITGLSFLRSPSWTFYLIESDRVVVDGIYIHTSLKEAVWCDGIDLNGCKDVCISNSIIKTGDDCLPMFASDRALENITITNCSLSSASAAIKFTEGIRVAARNVTIDNCAISDCNRGITLQLVMDGTIENVIISNLTMDLRRFDWFWAGHANPFNFEIKTLSEWNHRPPQPGDTGPGYIRNVTIRNIIAHVQGSSNIAGHPGAEHWLENVSFEDIKLFLSTDPQAPYDTSVDALRFRYARNLKIKGVEVFWEKPALDLWQSALSFEDIDGLELNDFRGSQAWPDRDIPAVAFNRVTNARVLNSQAAKDTNVFLGVRGETSRNICLLSNDFRSAKVPYNFNDGATSAELQAVSNILPSA